MRAPRAYYNEIDPYAAQWLRNLIAEGLIAGGEVDERSIADVRAYELVGFTQCHFFAGIAGWSHALRLAGWPDDRPVWTGSCPCQPFSAAGKGGGFDDERHLWPHFFQLIGECRPAVVFGEQVASPAGLEWLDLVQADLEGAGYAFAAVDCCSAGVGAPHVRQRIGFVADAAIDGERPLGGKFRASIQSQEPNRGCSVLGVMADAGSEGSWRHTGAIPCEEGEGSGERIAAWRLPDQFVAHVADRGTGPTNGFWRDPDWLLCRDGKWRPVEPGTFPLAHGVPARVGRLRAYGNAINPHQFAALIGAYLST